ncbi:hypothetical protein LTR85_010442 [Meristemomyces frigidus]|nr:hypothetical protein LTR85_010442 [Meristemomyces frigidus]
MSLKATIEIPLKGETARCTIEVPLNAIGATTLGFRTKATEDIITIFTSRVTAAVIEAVSPGQANEANGGVLGAIDITNPRDKAITINFRRAATGTTVPLKMKYNGHMQSACRAYDSRYKDKSNPGLIAT